MHNQHASFSKLLRSPSHRPEVGDIQTKKSLWQTITKHCALWEWRRDNTTHKSTRLLTCIGASSHFSDSAMSGACATRPSNHVHGGSKRVASLLYVETTRGRGDHDATACMVNDSNMTPSALGSARAHAIHTHTTHTRTQKDRKRKR